MGDLGVTAMRRLEKDLRSHAVDSGAPDGSPPKKMAGSMPTIRSGALWPPLSAAVCLPDGGARTIAMELRLDWEVPEQGTPAAAPLGTPLTRAATASPVSPAHSSYQSPKVCRVKTP